MNILFFLTPKSEVAYIPANESLRQAFEKLKYHGYSAVPTLTDDGKYAGTITEGDVLRAMESMCHWNISEAEKIKLPYLLILYLFSVFIIIKTDHIFSCHDSNKFLLIINNRNKILVCDYIDKIIHICADRHCLNVSLSFYIWKFDFLSF